MNFPPAPMPPGHGPFDDAIMGQPIQPMHDNDFQRHPQDGNFGAFRAGSPNHLDYDADFDGRGKKGKKNNKSGQGNRPRVDVHYEGYILEKAEPRRGEKPSWTRVGKRTMPLDEKKLADIVKLHFQKTRQSPQRDFEQLSSNQQGIVNRLIEERKLNERSSNADWVLADVQKITKRGWTSVELKKIQVILKRQDKFYQKPKDQSNRREQKTYQAGEILDLSDPVGKKATKNKNMQRTRSLDDLNDLNVFDNRGFGMPGGNFPPPLPPPPPGNHNFPPPMQGGDHFPGPINVPPPPPPPPFEQNGPGQFPPPPPFARHNSMGPPQFGNPFQPDPPFAAPGQYDSPSLDGDDHQYGPNGPRARARSKSQRRQSSARRPSLGARRASQRDDRVDNLTFKMENWQMDSNSSEDTYEDDSIFSRQNRGNRDFSEPSSPNQSHFSRGSLERTKSYRNRPRYRSHRYSDADIEPAYTYRDGHRYTPDSRRRSSRPKLHHSQTYDDYPMGRGAEPRYLPEPPRRLTNFDERYDYEDRDRDDMRPRRDGRELQISRRRSPVNYDEFQEGYEAARRDIMRRDSRDDRDKRRRRSVVAGGRPYWD